MNQLKAVIAVAAAVILIGGGSQANAREVSGLVRDQVSGLPVGNALVIVAESADTALTNSQGIYYFPDIPDGVYTMLVGKAGYSPQSMGSVYIGPSCCQGRVGDANGIGGDEPTIGDISVIIDMLFISGSPGAVSCMAEADVNKSSPNHPDGVVKDDVTIGDISILIDYLFITGPTLGLADCL